jgi:hypothetical protein
MPLYDGSHLARHPRHAQISDPGLDPAIAFVEEKTEEQLLEDFTVSNNSCCSFVLDMILHKAKVW